MSNTLQVVIPAAGAGKRLEEVNNYLPKALLKVNGIELLKRQIMSYQAAFSNNEISFIIVLGASHERVNQFLSSIKPLNYKVVYNLDYSITNCGSSLAKALPLITGNWIYSNSDLLVSDKIVRKISSSPHSNIVGVSYGEFSDLHRFRANSDNLISQWMPIDIGQKGDHSLQQLKTAEGEIVGPIKVNLSVSKELISIYSNLSPDEQKKISCYTLFSKLAHPIFHPLDITNDLWKEIDTVNDFVESKSIAEGIDSGF